MRLGRGTDSSTTRVVVVTADAEFERAARSTFGASKAIDLALTPGRIADLADTLATGLRLQRFVTGDLAKPAAAAAPVATPAV